MDWRSIAFSGLVLATAPADAAFAQAGAAAGYDGVRLVVSNEDMEGDLTFRFYIYSCGRHSGDAAIPIRRGQTIDVTIANCPVPAKEMIHVIVEGFLATPRYLGEFSTRATCPPRGDVPGPAMLRLALHGDPEGEVKMDCR